MDQGSDGPEPADPGVDTADQPYGDPARNGAALDTDGPATVAESPRPEPAPPRPSPSRLDDVAASTVIELLPEAADLDIDGAVKGFRRRAVGQVE